MDHDPITDADVQRFLEQGAQHDNSAMAAESKGRYFHQHVRARHAYQRLEAQR